MDLNPAGRASARREILRGVYEDNLRVVNKALPDEEDAPGVKPKTKLVTIGVLIPAVSFILVSLAFPLFSRPDEAAVLRDTPIDLVTPGEMARYASEDSVTDLGTTVADASSYNAIAADENIPLATLFDLQVRTIVIDAGHGGKDGGAVGEMGTREKDITLDVARRLKERLERRQGFRVLMTRSDDRYISLRGRVEYANAHKADLFISVHVNYLPSDPSSVVETYYFGPQKDKNTLLLAEKENRYSDYSVADFDDMIKKIGNTMRLQESKRTAISIQSSLYRNMRKVNQKTIDSGIKSAPFVVLLGVEAPSVLAEIACLSNRDEESKLNTPAHRERIAMSLEAGVVHYLQQRPNNNELAEGATEHNATKTK